jgi:hypothetical protein
VAEHQLDDPDVDAVGSQAARAFVTQVVPAEIDPFEMFSIPLHALSSSFGFDVVRE